MSILGTIRQRLTGATELDPVRDGGGVQGTSRAFWERSTDTYLGSPEYYDRRAEVLERVLVECGPWGRGVDVGCGEGRFTIQAAAHVGRMEGTDIGPALIEQARSHNSPVTFSVADVTDPLEAGVYDLVMALGVTSCLTDDDVLAAMLANVHAALKSDGTFITVDSVTPGPERLARFDNGYVARYRNEWRYVDLMRDAGFDLADERQIGTPSRNKWVRMLPIVQQNTNHLWRFTKG